MCENCKECFKIDPDSCNHDNCKEKDKIITCLDCNEQFFNCDHENYKILSDPDRIGWVKFRCYDCKHFFYEYNFGDDFD